MVDRRWLELKLVQLGERYPERVGARGRLGVHGDHCIVGEIMCEAGSCGEWNGNADTFSVAASFDPGFKVLWAQAVALNNQGVAWGAIPRLLGLVPGEAPVPTTVTVW